MAKKTPPVNSLKWNKSEWHPIHHFSPGSVEPHLETVDAEKTLLGGKGAGLAQMCRLDMPVPPGFTIDTDCCLRFTVWPAYTMSFMKFRLVKSYTALSKLCGHAPLVSVRSGAKFSMPGMMDTIPNVGLTTENMGFWVSQIGAKAAWDCRRRLIEEFGAVVHGIDREKFHKVTEADPLTMGAEELEALSHKYEMVFKVVVGTPFPEDPMDQILESVMAVFSSWGNERAIAYREMEGISHDLGTAVTVQKMVFGNAGSDCGTGVLFTRNPATGEDIVMGEFLQNAQGEDVVAGTATPMPLLEMCEHGFQNQFIELLDTVNVLEEHFNDMQDVEFTIEKGKLFILQTRNGKRTAEAAFRIATEMVADKKWTKAAALSKVSNEQFVAMQKEIVNPAFMVEPMGTGLAASPGFACGAAVFSNAAACASVGPCILVREDTDPNDLPGMNAAEGILTGTGGITSHAAVVARAINTPCVTAFGDALESIKAGDLVTIDGGTGRVWVGGTVPTVSGAENPHVKKMIDWGYEVTGALYESGTVEKEAQRVLVAEWLGEPELMNASLKALAGMNPKERGQIILDIRSLASQRREEDLILWNAFGEDAAEEDLNVFDSVIGLLEDAGLAGTIITLEGALKSHAPGLELAGYKVGREVDTLADLLHSTGPVTVSEEFIDGVVGGSSVYVELIETFKAAGKPVIPMPESMTPQEVAAKAFSG